MHRESESIVDWVNKHSVSNSEYMPDCAQLKSAARGEEAMISAFFGPLDSLAYKTHIETSLISSLMPSWRFIHTDDQKCAEDMEINFPGVSLFRQFDYDFLQIPLD